MISSSDPSLDSILVERLRANGTNRSHPSGHRLFRQGAPSGSVMLVEAGTVGLYRIDEAGNRRLVETIEPGGLIGDVDVLDQGPRSATAIVMADAVVRHISAEIFHTVLRTDHELQQAILQRAATCLRAVAAPVAISLVELLARAAAGLLDTSPPVALHRRLRILSLTVLQAYIVL